MKSDKHTKNPSLVRYTRNSLAQEFSAWGSLFRTEWRWALVIIAGVLLLLVFTKPLPPRDVYLAVGQPGSKFEAFGQQFVPYFNAQGLNLHLVHTRGSAANIATLADNATGVNAALAVAGVANKGQFPNLESLGSIEPLIYDEIGAESGAASCTISCR